METGICIALLGFDGSVQRVELLHQCSAACSFGVFRAEISVMRCGLYSHSTPPHPPRSIYPTSRPPRTLRDSVTAT